VGMNRYTMHGYKVPSSCGKVCFVLGLTEQYIEDSGLGKEFTNG
jgi:hypothetical protein